MSKTYQCRPSEILGITNTGAAFHADRATMNFCTALENAMSAVDKRKIKMSDVMKMAEKQKILDHWLGLVNEKDRGRFRDPAANFAG